MGFFKKKKPEQPQSQSQPQQEDPMGQMDASIRPGGVFMVQPARPVLDVHMNEYAAGGR